MGRLRDSRRNKPKTSPGSSWDIQSSRTLPGFQKSLAKAKDEDGRTASHPSGHTNTGVKTVKIFAVSPRPREALEILPSLLRPLLPMKGADDS